MTADPYARLDAAYLLGALDADERLAYEAHLAICRRCRAGLAEISAIPSLLAGLDESVFAAPPEVPSTPVPDTLLPRLLQAAGRERARRRWLTTSLGLLAAACAIALIVIVVPSSSGPKPAPRAMAGLVATPVDATIALQPRSWGTEIDLTCWYQRGAAEPPSDRYELAAAWSRHMRTCVRGRDETGPVSQGRWLVSLTQWTAANPRPCHWISLMQAEPRYSR